MKNPNIIPVVALRPEEPTVDYKAQEGLGQHPRWEPGLESNVAFDKFVKLPAFYTITINLGGDPGSNLGGSVPIRPEPLVIRRITFACTGDTPVFTSGLFSGSVQGRSVEITWGDEFVSFLGDIPCLMSALFGDSQGYLDIPRGILIQGRQTLKCKLNRILWPDLEIEPAVTRFDICFQGIALLPPGQQESGTPR